MDSSKDSTTPQSNIPSNNSSTTRNEWWKMFGYGAPNLKKLAIHILGQTSSSFGSERNWSVFERMHTKKKKKRLEHKRLNDLVFVHYNSKLKNMYLKKERSFDPIDYESTYATNFWILENVEKHESPSNVGEEIEKILYEKHEEPRLQRKCRHEQEDDNVGVHDAFVVENISDAIDFSSMNDFE